MEDARDAGGGVRLLHAPAVREQDREVQDEGHRRDPEVHVCVPGLGPRGPGGALRAVYDEDLVAGLEEFDQRHCQRREGCAGEDGGEHARDDAEDADAVFQCLVLCREALEFCAFVGGVRVRRDGLVEAIAVPALRVLLRVVYRFEVVLVGYLLVLSVAVDIRHVETCNGNY